MAEKITMTIINKKNTVRNLGRKLCSKLIFEIFYLPLFLQLFLINFLKIAYSNGFTINGNLNKTRYGQNLQSLTPQAKITIVPITIITVAKNSYKRYFSDLSIQENILRKLLSDLQATIRIIDSKPRIILMISMMIRFLRGYTLGGWPVTRQNIVTLDNHLIILKADDFMILRRRLIIG